METEMQRTKRVFGDRIIEGPGLGLEHLPLGTRCRAGVKGQRLGETVHRCCGHWWWDLL